MESELHLGSATVGQLMVRRAKVAWFQGRRLAAWVSRPERWRGPELADSRAAFPDAAYDRQVPIARCDGGADPILEAGKLHNLALAAPHFDGIAVSPERPLSFWRTLGRATAARGFRHGMELRAGCIVPTVGGGLCLLSNALFRMASELGWHILERHGHTMDATPPVPGELWGLDATVFWPHVDLRVAPRAGVARLGVAVRDGVLAIDVRTRDTPHARTRMWSEADAIDRDARGRVRRNRVVREVVAADTGAVLAREVIADNRKRLLRVTEQRRNCLTCDETGCDARPADLAVLMERTR